MKTKSILFLILLWILPSSSAYGSGSGLLTFKTEGEVWEVVLNDSLTCRSTDSLQLAAGMYILRARPAYDYRWPGPFIQDTLKLAEGAELCYTLFNRNRLSHIPLPGRINFPPPNTQPEPGTTVFYKKPYFKNSLLATAILANWAAFYSKRLADKSYEHYLQSSRQSTIKSYYRQSENYDILSNILLGVSVTALSGYFWLLMED